LPRKLFDCYAALITQTTSEQYGRVEQKGTFIKFVLKTVTSGYFLLVLTASYRGA